MVIPTVFLTNGKQPESSSQVLIIISCSENNKQLLHMPEQNKITVTLICQWKAIFKCLAIQKEMDKYSRLPLRTACSIPQERSSAIYSQKFHADEVKPLI